MRKYCYLLLFLFGINSAYPQDKEQSSLFDYSAVDFTKDTVVELTGDWDFYWGELIVSKEHPNKVVSGEVPEFWKNYPQKYAAQGYGTYITTIKLDKHHPLLAFQLGDIHNSYKFFINGKLVRKVGKVGAKKEETVAKWVPQVIIIEDTSSVLELVIQVANFRHRNGGIQHPIILANTGYLLAEKESVMFADLFLGGASLVIGLFFFGMYFFWKKDKSAMFFGLFCFSFSIRVFIVGSRSLLTLLPWLPWNIAIRFEYLALFFTALFFVYFIYHSFKAQAPKLFVKVVTYFYLLIIAIVIFLPGTIFTYTIFPNNILLLIIGVYTLFVYVKAFRMNAFGAGWALFSFAVFFVAVGLAIAEYANLFVPSPILVSAGFVAFIFTMSLIFASRFGKAFSDVEELKESAELQSEKISEQHDLIKDSIQYAKRIQRALLPSKKAIQEKLPNSIIYYNPQSVVSGDFYWYKFLEETNEVILVISDCTGHGVPGAFMSIVGISSLDKIVSTNPDFTPAQILGELNGEIRQKLNSDIDEQVQDGMDIIVCKIALDTNKMIFSSALHKLVLLRKGEARLYNGCRHFIGNNFKENFSFHEEEIHLEKEDQIFMFSDGIYDQKGGEKGKKLYYKRFEKILIEMGQKPISEQETYLADRITKWQGDQEQLDDMLVFGWKVL